MRATDMPWGTDLAGRNEQAIATAVAATASQLKETFYLPLPWSRYQAAQANGELALAGHLQQKLEALLQRAIEAEARHVITTYAGADLEWASEQIGRCRAITAVFSCLLTRDFNPAASQRWHPIALPCADAATLETVAPLPYRHLQQIWQAVEAGQLPCVPQGQLLLPGNQDLWMQLFAGAEQAQQGPASKAATLIAEEHGDQRGVIQILRTLASNAAEAFSLDANNVKLAKSSRPESATRSQSAQIAYALRLKHSHRTPLAYRQIAERCPRLRCVDLKTSIAMTGRPGDNNRGSNSLCISEEPWWDLLSCGGRYSAGETGYLDGLFDELPIPYYLAINPLILDRIGLRLEQLATTSTEVILQRLIQAPIHYIGIHEFRLSQERTGAVHPSLSQRDNLLAIGGLRTKIGIHARARGLGPSHGKGWGQRGFKGLRRNSFADWHLDKLQLIRASAPRLGMAIENVHWHSYVTEKPFDMLCSGVVPLTYAAPNHELHRYLDTRAHLNLYGHSLPDALKAIEQFQPSETLACAIQSSASQLSHLFGSSTARESTIDLVAERCEQWVLKQCRTHTYQLIPNQH